MYMETAKQDFNLDVKNFFKKKRGYVSNDGMITFYTIKDKRQYDMCCPYERSGVQKGCVDKHEGLKDKSDLK